MRAFIAEKGGRGKQNQQPHRPLQQSSPRRGGMPCPSSVRGVLRMQTVTRGLGCRRDFIPCGKSHLNGRMRRALAGHHMLHEHGMGGGRLAGRIAYPCSDDGRVCLRIRHGAHQQALIRALFGAFAHGRIGSSGDKLTDFGSSGPSKGGGGSGGNGLGRRFRFAARPDKKAHGQNPDSQSRCTAGDTTAAKTPHPLPRMLPEQAPGRTADRQAGNALVEIIEEAGIEISLGRGLHLRLRKESLKLSLRITIYMGLVCRNLIHSKNCFRLMGRHKVACNVQKNPENSSKKGQKQQKTSKNSIFSLLPQFTVMFQGHSGASATRLPFVSSRLTSATHRAMSCSAPAISRRRACRVSAAMSSMASMS